MKVKNSFLLLLLMLSINAFAQYDEIEEATGLPGDAFSLEGAIDLFKKSASPEDFEKQLNSDNYVNNLDLNEDGKVDFIRVNGYMEDDVHAFVLQVDISESEIQDIAVIEIERTGEEDALLQIIGEEDLYGESVIIEPTEISAQTIGKGPSADIKVERIVVNVWAWPTVQFIYRPTYRVYRSPYRWGVYPVRWWNPWRPRTWVVCNNYRRVNYRPHYRIATSHRVVRAHNIYKPHRRTTTVVRTKTVTQVAANKKSGRVVQGNRVVKTRSTSTTVNGKNKTVTRSKTTKKTKTNKNNKAVVKKSKVTRKRTKKN